MPTTTPEASPATSAHRDGRHRASHRLRRLALTGAAVIAAAGIAASFVGSAAAAAGGGLTADQRRRADQLISIFENSTPEIQYGYAENLNDGRGVTAGRAGFTTGDGDALQVVQAYTNLVPDNPLAQFIPSLQQNGSGLDEAAYIAAWKEAANDQVFRDVQDAQVEARYFSPAMQDADQLGLATALARAELYDASIQHGNTSNGDALPALISRTTAKVGTPGQAGEQTWLNTFFDVRVDDLKNPQNTATAAEWAGSVDRVEAMRRIAATGNYQLDGPLPVTAFGTSYTLQ
nr:chitosanase [Streptomyces sp. NBC_00886]